MTTEMHKADAKVDSCNDVARKRANPFLTNGAIFVPFVSAISVIQRLDLEPSRNREPASRFESLGKVERRNGFLIQPAISTSFRCIRQRKVRILFKSALIVSESSGNVSAQLLLISRGQKRKSVG